jgi:hypothetical protein
MTLQFSLTEEERKYLVALLDSERREKHAEVRRTESSSLHDELRREENLLRGLMDKLQATEAACKV